MDKIKDVVHDCFHCDYFPCSTQDEVTRKDICMSCPVQCCKQVLVTLTPCEEDSGRYEIGKFGGLKMGDDGWCVYYDKKIKKAI